MAKYRYRCPYCNRAFKSAGAVQRHKNAGTRRGACVADPDAALAANKPSNQGGPSS